MSVSLLSFERKHRKWVSTRKRYNIIDIRRYIQPPKRPFSGSILPLIFRNRECYVLLGQTTWKMKRGHPNRWETFGGSFSRRENLIKKTIQEVEQESGLSLKTIDSTTIISDKMKSGKVNFAFIVKTEYIPIRMLNDRLKENKDNILNAIRAHQYCYPKDIRDVIIQKDGETFRYGEFCEMADFRYIPLDNIIEAILDNKDYVTDPVDRNKPIKLTKKIIGLIRNNYRTIQKEIQKYTNF